MSDEQLVIELDIAPERLNELTWEDWEIIDQAPNLDHGQARNLISKFVKASTPEEAYQKLGKLKTGQMVDVLNKFVEAVNALKTVNPPTGGSS